MTSSTPARPTSSHSSSQPPLTAPQQAQQQPHSPAAPPPPPPDLFVLVRPPPGSSAHPLNLQVQLLVPSTAHRPSAPGGAGVSATSLDKVAGASVSRDGEVGHSDVGGGEGRRRSGSFERARSSSRGRASPGGSARVSRSPSLSSLASGRSGYSAYSGESGVTGTSSAGTGTGTGTGSGRRKVTPLLNLAFHSVLPTVVTDAGTDQRVAKFAKRGVEFTGLAIFDPVDLALANSPSASTSSEIVSPTATRLSPTQSRATNGATSTAGGGGFLGTFKRLSFNPSASSPSSTSAPDSRSSKLFSSLSAAPSPSTSSPSKPPSSDVAPSGPSPHTLPLLRTSSPPHTPSPSTLAPPSSERAEKGYAFVLRKWLRADLEGAPRGVRVEWSRRRMRDLKNASRRGSEAEHGSEEKPAPEEEEDEEDPDTPWVCTLVYPLSGAHASPNPAGAAAGAGERSGASSPATSLRRGGVEDSPPLSSSTTQGFALSPTTSSSAPTTRRLHLATLRPAPYHPKLVSTLLLPPLLPSIPLGTFHPSRGLQGGVLGPEELRDLVMVSAMWVAVREGLGGLEGVKVETGIAGMGEGVEQVVAGLKEKGQGVKKVVSIGSGSGAKEAGGQRERKGGIGLGIRERLFR